MPALYALLPNKQGATYRRLFAEIKNLQPALNPETIMTDYELAAINAFTAEFPAALQRGCFFHFNQCIWRKLQELGLKARYENDEIFALQTKMIPALAFVPTNDVVATFEILNNDNLYLPAELNPLMNYFEDTWIGRIANRNGRRQVPMFPVRLWNCYDAIRDGKPKQFIPYALLAIEAQGEPLIIIRRPHYTTDTYILQAWRKQIIHAKVGIVDSYIYLKPPIQQSGNLSRF